MINQNYPASQSQKLLKPTNSYGLPPSVVNTYGPPTTTDAIETFDQLKSVTYGPPTDSYGTPPIKLTSTVTESSVFGQFAASQPFTARPTNSVDQTRLGSSKIEQNSNSQNDPIPIADSAAADEIESTHVPQNKNSISDEDQPISHDLNTTATPLEEMHTESTESNAIHALHKKTENSIRKTPLNLLETPNSYFRKANESRVPEFKLVRNTWKPLPPNPFSNPPPVTTLAPDIPSSPVTPSASSSGFQIKNYLNESTEQNYQNAEKQKKLQIIIPYIKSKTHPSPFRNSGYQSFETSDGWSQSDSHDDFHDSEESQVISAATSSPSTNPIREKNNKRYLTKILANNIRETLKREQAKNVSSIDLEKLQKNIDGWTEQEFSVSPNHASTISLLTQPKHIPFEYLTTRYMLPCQYHNILDFVMK